MKVNLATILDPGGLRAPVLTLVMVISPALSTNLRADVIFSSITGPCCGGLAVTGSTFSSESVATAFVPSVSEFLADAEAVVFAVGGFGGDPHFNMALFSSVSGAPGSLIEQLGTDLTAPAAALGGIIKAASSLHPTLFADTQYWVVLTPFDNLTDVGWEQGGSVPSPVDSTISPLGIGGWAPVGGPNPDLQFQIDGVTEPCSLLLFVTVVGTALVRLSTIASGRPTR